MPVLEVTLCRTNSATPEQHLEVFGSGLWPMRDLLMSRKVPRQGWLLCCVAVLARWLALIPHNADNQMQSHMHWPAEEYALIRGSLLRVPCQSCTQNDDPQTFHHSLHSCTLAQPLTFHGPLVASYFKVEQDER